MRNFALKVNAFRRKNRRIVRCLCDLNHNFAIWQGYGLFGFQLQPECPSWPPVAFTMGSDSQCPVSRAGFLNPSRLIAGMPHLRSQLPVCRRLPANLPWKASVRQSSQCPMNRLSSFFSFELSYQSAAEASSGRGSRGRRSVATKTSCCTRFYCAEWSCVVLTDSPRYRNGSGRVWPVMPTTRDRPAAQFLVTRLCGCLEQLQSDVASAGLTLVRWGRKSAGTPRRPLEHPYSGAQARASQSGSQSALSGVFLRSKPRVGAGARKAHRGSTTSDGPKCALLFNYDAAMQLSP